MIVMGTYNTASMRQSFLDEYSRLLADPEVDVTQETIDLQGVSFLADQPTIFGALNEDYIERELEWYLSKSLNVNDFPGGAPAIWKQVASKHDTGGWINSNYGYLFLDEENGAWADDGTTGEFKSQFWHVVHELKRDPKSRRATAVYTRPSIHAEAQDEGMQDFICTNAVNYRRDGDAVDCIVQMRSNDAVFGYRNDLAWQQYALKMVADALDLRARHVVWQAASLHIYPRHQHLIETYIKTGVHDGPVTREKAA